MNADSAVRGCAFINAIAEVGGGAAETLAIAQQHKREMEDVMADLLPEGPARAARARAVAMAVDGAIVRAQMTGAQPALEGCAPCWMRLPPGADLPLADEANALVEIGRQVLLPGRRRLRTLHRLARNEPADEFGSRGRAQRRLGLDGG